MKIHVEHTNGLELFQNVRIPGEDRTYIITGFVLERTYRVGTKKPKVAYVLLTLCHRDEKTREEYIIGDPFRFNIDNIILI